MNRVPLARRGAPLRRRPPSAATSGAHDVHADAAAGDLRNLRRRREARLEQELDELRIGGLGVGGEADPATAARSRTRVKSTPAPSSARSITTSLPTWRTVSEISPVSELAGLDARVARFDAVVQRIAQQMLERADQLLQHRAVELDLGAVDLEVGALVRAPSPSRAGSGTGARTGCRTAPCGSRTGAAALRATSRACASSAASASSRFLSSECCTVETSLMPSASERVSSWKRVYRSNSSGSKSPALFLHQRHLRLDLRFRLDFDLAHLRAQPDHAVGQFEQVRLQRAQLAFDARARDGHFAGLVDEPVDDVGADPQLRARADLEFGCRFGLRRASDAARASATGGCSCESDHDDDRRCRSGVASGTTTESATGGAESSPAAAVPAGLVRDRSPRQPRVGLADAQAVEHERDAVERRFRAPRSARASPEAHVASRPGVDSMRCVSSPSRIAPAMRALPLNVCSVRRNSATALPSCGLRLHARKRLARLREQFRCLVQENRQAPVRPRRRGSRPAGLPAPDGKRTSSKSDAGACCQASGATIRKVRRNGAAQRAR